MKEKPTGFIAICQCRKIVGAMDIEEMRQADVGKTLAKWLSGGCTVEPKFSGNWSVQIGSCVCLNDYKALKRNNG